jgi:hypothetical protein
MGPAPAQSHPLVHEPEDHPSNRTAQERHVLGYQEQTDRQHLDAHQRQEPEHAA